MTFTPSRPCSHPGCAALVAYGEGTRCPGHRRQRTEDRRQVDRFRGSAAARGYDSTWQRERLAFLQKYPLCMGVLLATADWTPALAQEFHALREQQREQGKLLIFPANSADQCRIKNHLRESAPSASSAEKFLRANPIYRFQPWDIARPATVVDHIVPHRGNYELMWAEWNWQPLTKRAHDRKTATEQARGRAPCAFSPS